MWIPIAAALLALGLSFGVTKAAEDAECKGSWNAGSAIVAQRGGTVVELTPSQRMVLQDDYNSTEPKTDYIFDHIYTIDMPGAPEGMLMIVFVQGNDCVADSGGISRDRLRSLISRHNS